MARSTLRVWTAQISLFLVFAGILFVAILLSRNLAHWLSDVVPGRARFFQYSVVILVSVLVELPLFWFVGVLLLKVWRSICRQWLSADEMIRLQDSLRRL
jgi:hypothetical protein